MSDDINYLKSIEARNMRLERDLYEGWHVAGEINDNDIKNSSDVTVASVNHWMSSAKRVEIAERIVAGIKLTKFFKKVEWVMDTSLEEFCPLCENSKEQGHVKTSSWICDFHAEGDVGKHFVKVPDGYYKEGE